METIKSYKLSEIANWQKKAEKITLPSLQRGFVWKPHQTEDLWDSVLRGYPIGAIMISKDDKDNKELLDGQQRCTSIALGFYNPFKEENDLEFLSLKDYLPSLWIDLKPIFSSKNIRKYAIRQLTKSHPWGYQLNDNRSPLSMSDRRRAAEYFHNEKQPFERYIDLSPKNISPWDAYYPIPLSFLLEIDTTDKQYFIKQLKEKISQLSIKTKHSNGENVDFKTIDESEFLEFFSAIRRAHNLLIPEIVVEANILEEDEDNIPETQDPTLFVRLNSSGTSLNGEELIYSIYKAAFPQAKNMVENIGASYIAPSKIINIFSRLTICEMNNFQSFPRENNVTSFRKDIRDPNFRQKLQSYIENNEECEAKKLINTAIKILKQEKENFPPILIKQFITTNPNLFLALIIYIKKNKLHLTKLTKKDIKDISSSYVYIMWFGIEDKKIPSLITSSFANHNFNWREIVRLLISEQLVFPIITPEIIRESLSFILIEKKVEYNDIDKIKKRNLLPENIQLLLSTSNSIETKDQIDNILISWIKLIHKIFWNKSMLLYAQKEYLNSKFKDYNQFENIEDTNRPWDWDHIYPHSWVYNKREINRLVKNWVNSIGNIRALSYDDNRSENNHLSPFERLKSDEKRTESFIKESDYHYWVKLKDNDSRIKNNDKNTPLANFLGAVVNRTVNIYEEWYNSYFSI
nr:DUF262 domain-containing protein [uncultured Flavobacterium sp.]